jgi:hypothetical protein
VDERIKQLLKELGDAINESISSSADVNEHIQRIKDEGYNLYVVLDATIGLNREEDAGSETIVEPAPTHEVQFRINVNDLGFLKSVGIDPTRKVRSGKRTDRRIVDGRSRGE